MTKPITLTLNLTSHEEYSEFIDKCQEVNIRPATIMKIYKNLFMKDIITQRTLDHEMELLEKKGNRNGRYKRLM